MHYNFNEIIPRRNTQSVKWDLDKDPAVLPMWVADMDFKTCPAVLEALEKRVAHGIFGYTLIPDSFYEAIIDWWKKRHGFILQQDWLIPATGIIPASSAIVRALTKPGDKILLQPPVYNHFYETLNNCGCEIVENCLLEKDLQYTIDFEDLEQQCADPDMKLFVLCNPHNPIGRVWSKEDLIQIGEICFRNNVIVLADEIHSDLIFEGFKHIPFASLGEEFSQNSITCSSPSKTFNIAGIQAAYVFTANTKLKQKIDVQLSKTQESNMLSPFAVEALIAAYKHGETWLEELKVYLFDNYQFVKNYLAEHLPHLQIPELQATYLVWLDCRQLTSNSTEFALKIKRENKVWLNAGDEYGTTGNGFLRLNIGCPRSQLVEAMERLKEGLKK